MAGGSAPMAEKGQKLLVSLPVLVILPPQDRLVIPAPISAEREGCPKTCSGPCMTLQRGGHEDVGLQACSAGRGPFLLLVCPELLHIRNQKDSPSISRSFWQKDVLFPGTRVSSFCARKVFCQQIHPGWKEVAHHWQLPYCEWADAFSLCLMANWNKMDTLYVIIKYMPSWL